MADELINKRGGNKQRWHTQDKIEALLLLQRNNFKLSETARELKINKQTLLLWKNQMGDQVFGDAAEQAKEKKRQEIEKFKDEREKSELELGVLKAARKLTLNEGDFLNAVYYTKHVLLDKIVTLANTATNIRDVAYALDVLEKVKGGMAGQFEDEFSKQKLSFMEMVKKQYSTITTLDVTMPTTDLPEDDYEILKDDDDGKK